MIAKTGREILNGLFNRMANLKQIPQKIIAICSGLGSRFGTVSTLQSKRDAC